MKAPLTALLIAVLAVVAFLAFAASAAAAPDELLMNGGFEEGVTGWDCSGGLISYVNEPFHSGGRAAILIVDEAEGCIHQTVRVSPGADYCFGGWVYRNTIYAAAVFLQVSWYESGDGSGHEIRHHESASLASNADDYRPLIAGIQSAPANAHSATVRGIVTLAETAQAASAYFDDMFLIETTAIPTPMPTPTCAPNLLLANPGFEEGVANWSNYGGSFSLFELLVKSGDFAAALTSNTASTKWIYQVVTIQGGGTYTLCGYAIKNDPNIEKILLRVSWYEREDGFGSEISHVDSLIALRDDEAEYRLLTTGQVTAPPDARSARAKAMLEPASTGDGTAYFDDLSFTGPAPSTPTPCPTPTPVSTAAPTVVPLPTPTATATACPTPKTTPEPAPTPAATPEASPTPMVTPGPTPTLEGTRADTGDVLINEVQYDPPQSGYEEHRFEWVELYNPTEGAIELAGWTISDNHESDSIPSLIIPAGCFAVIAAAEGIYGNFPELDCTVVFLQDGRIGNGLNNEGDCLILRDSSGNVIDAVSYGDDSSQDTHHRDVAQGHSVERSPPGGGLVDNPFPTPGQGLYPGVIPTPVSTSVVIPAATPGFTPTSTSTPAGTQTATATPLAPPTPQADDGGGSSGVALRAILIVTAIACLVIGLWVRRRSAK